MTEIKKPIVLKGVGVSRGIAIGRAYLVDRSHFDIVPQSSILPEDVEKEVERFHDALNVSMQQLLVIQESIQDKELQSHLHILDTHKTILRDRLLIEETEKRIRNERINAEWALKQTLHELRKIFEMIQDQYLRERKSDVEYVGERILRNLIGKKQRSVTDMSDEGIIVAHDLSPADTAQMNKQMVMAFVTDIGGKTSHTAIMAKAMGIPAVVGLENITRLSSTGGTLIVDGTSGLVIVNPSHDAYLHFLDRQERYRSAERVVLHHYSRMPGETRDGYRVRIGANVERVDELPTLRQYGAEGIGLYRTEFLYLGRKELPSEEEQYKTYKKAVEACVNNPVVIRTLDIGGDKFLTHLDLAEEMNPAMGLRAIRFSLRQPDIFLTQLRAILRAGALGEVKILFPMISGVEEVIQVKEIIKKTEDELRREGQEFKENMEIGIMMEIPSAMAIADLLAKEVDFFSIGTNDLIQYSLAIDRVNEQVAYLYQPLHPAVLRTVQRAAEAAHSEGVTVALCGEMAGEPLYIPILLGFQLDELSMNPVCIPRVKKIIRSLSMQDCQSMLLQVLQMRHAEEIHQFVLEEMEKRLPEDFLNEYIHTNQKTRTTTDSGPA
jgi:phosphotransferase system enzyme I (PtsI)